MNILTISILSALILTGCGGDGSTETQKPTSIPSADNAAPVISLNGENHVRLIEGNAYSDPGASATDDVDGEVNVVVSGNIDTSPGEYTLTYTATDKAGNTASVTRTITVEASVSAIPPDNIVGNASFRLTRLGGGSY